MNKEFARVQIRGEVLKLERAEDITTISVNVDRNYQRNGTTVHKHPMVINIRTQSPPYRLEKGNAIDIAGTLYPVHYIWYPTNKSRWGNKIIIPEPIFPKGLERPWELVGSRNWKEWTCMVNLFEAQAAQIKSTQSRSKQQPHSIRIEALGRIFPRREAETNGTQVANFQLEVMRTTQKGITLQPIRIRGTAWNNLASIITSTNSSEPVEITGFLEPWYKTWAPKEGTLGAEYTHTEDPSKPNYIANPLALYTSERWHPRCHMWQTFQLTVDELNGETDWRLLSQQCRDRAQWKCEECSINLEKDPIFLHAHHMRGKQHNKPEDLKALCFGCHAGQARHNDMKNLPGYQEFMKKYGHVWKQNNRKS